MKLEIVNSGTEEFPFYQIMEGEIELCACDDIKKAERIVKLCKLHIVSQQSELLLAFANFLKWKKEGYIAYSNEKEMVRDFKANNGG